MKRLRALGGTAAWLKLRELDPAACLHCLLALEGAAEGVPKAALAPEKKAELKRFFNARK